jgi:large conductance mechanosensitive channel
LGLKHGKLPGLEANVSLEIRMLQEFKEFALRGNVVDMAVGIIIGAAFSTIVRSLVDDIVMPPFGVLTGGVDFSNIFIALNGQHYDSLAQARQAGAPTLNIGVFINNVISFLIVAVVLFMAIKAMNQLRRKQEEDPQSEPPPSREVQVLEEIRDALLDRRDRPA